ncbi:MAG TPA: hypothetical protein PKU91_04445, partial [Phycisphaerales bacterium]|nr:hypothetical protein [Phycisphaerales bacterium]
MPGSLGRSNARRFLTASILACVVGGASGLQQDRRVQGPPNRGMHQSPMAPGSPFASRPGRSAEAPLAAGGGTRSSGATSRSRDHAARDNTWSSGSTRGERSFSEGPERSGSWGYPSTPNRSDSFHRGSSRTSVSVGISTGSSWNHRGWGYPTYSAGRSTWGEWDRCGLPGASYGSSFSLSIRSGPSWHRAPAYCPPPVYRSSVTYCPPIAYCPPVRRVVYSPPGAWCPPAVVWASPVVVRPTTTYIVSDP